MDASGGKKDYLSDRRKDRDRSRERTATPARRRGRSESPGARIRETAQKAKAKVNERVLEKCPKRYLPLIDKYAELVNASVPWTWTQIQFGLDPEEKSLIRNYARDSGKVPTVPLDPRQDYIADPPPGLPPFVIFPDQYIKDSQVLDVKDRKKPNRDQFEILNQNLAARNKDYEPETQTFKGSPVKYTWHHDQDPPGQMRLVEFGIHKANKHTGGRQVWGGGRLCK
jgi:hypothetical protein